jgi:hypothetical protein
MPDCKRGDVTSTWKCAECGDGPFDGTDLIEHARAHGHELRFGDFSLLTSTNERRRPLPDALGEGPPTETLF